MSITSDILRGHTEAIILSHLLEQDSYGYQINKDIMKKTENQYELKEATLYSAFRRLEQSGYIRTYWGDETTEPEGATTPLRKRAGVPTKPISRNGRKQRK